MAQTKSNAGKADTELQKRMALAEIKAKRIEALEQLKKFKETHRLLEFKPHEKQQQFFMALQDKSKRTFVLLGGNRSGKTEANVAAVVSLATGRYPWVPEPERKPTEAVRIVDGRIIEKQGGLDVLDPGLLRFKPPIKIRLFGEDMTALEQVQIPKLESMLFPEDIAAVKRNSFGLKVHWILKNGSVIDLLTYNQDPGMMEGWNGHVCSYDEPPPRAVRVANLRGLVDHGGIEIFSMTPLKEPWIANEIVNKPDASVYTLVMNTRENPHLKEEFIQSFEESLTEEEKETRIGGKFLHLQGLVFKEFDKEEHVIDSFEPKHEDTCYASVDTHPRTEQAIAFMSVDQRGNQFIVHESFSHGTPDAVADRLIDFHKTIHPLRKVIIEPGSKGDSNRGESTFEIIYRRLRAEGVPLELGSKDLSGGILLMKEAFRSRNGLASLFIARRCGVLIKELGTYVWKDWREGGSSDKTEMNKPVDKDDHLIECVRRLIQLPAKWYPANLNEQFQTKYVPMDEEAGY